jgi:quercetin dioxygenase-like cupin family protein
MGPYRRNQIEECFFVLRGTGVITVGNDRLPVRKGDVVFAGLGEARQLAGPREGAKAKEREELVLWNLGVAMDHHVDEAADCSSVEL